MSLSANIIKGSVFVPVSAVFLGSALIDLCLVSHEVSLVPAVWVALFKLGWLALVTSNSLLSSSSSRS